MYTINKVVLTNFKFFFGEVPIDFGGGHTLIYGENGSGKSSIFWALYTFFQSSLKTPQEVIKYFAHNSDVNLRNRFADDEAESGITVTFSDGIDRTISNVRNTTKRDANDKFVLEATLGSDLIEYRTLSRIYLFAHSEEIDLFPFFKNNLLPFINFKNPFIKHDGSDGNNNAEDFWQYLDKGIDIYSDAQEDKSFDQFQPIVALFNTEFDRYLNDIAEAVNIYLTDKFKQNIKIKLRYIDAVGREDYIDEDRKRISVEEPKIILDVWLLSDKLPEEKRKIFNPQSFLNEAKLTALALSMRLAILDEKYVKAYPKILVLDDFLMSMDMSNREAVLQIILDNYLKEYQILFFTHQRGFFEDAKNFIQDYHANIAKNEGESNPELLNSEWQKHWKIYEMYETANGANIPVPNIQPFGTPLQKALYYFKDQIDYSACGNNLRTALEEFFLKFIPHNFLNNQTMLAGLLVSAQNYFSYVGFDTAPLDKLERYRERSLNPSSHYNPRADYFRAELQDVFSILEGLKKNLNQPVLKKDQTVTFDIATESGKVYSYTAVLLDDIILYRKNDGSGSYFLDTDKRGYAIVQCVEGETVTKFDNIDTGGTLQELYDEKCDGLIQFKHETPINRNDMYKVFKNSEGVSLENLKMY